MTKKERETIQKVCDYFDYHNKNLTKVQEALIDDLKDLIKSWVARYKTAGQTETAAKARAKYWRKYKKTHKKQIKEYYLINRERIREKSRQYYWAKKAEKLAALKNNSGIVGKSKKK